ncbi:MAG: malate/lactate/ureidoglycolate dehydrogenase [Betaproteobacteria bacterium]
MTSVHYLQLTDFVASVIRATGSSPAEAQMVGTRLVASNLAGHESHGVLRVPKYLDWVNEGMLRPNQHVEVVFDAGSVLIVEGHLGFGQVIGEEAGRLGIARAAQTGIALVGLRNSGHLGRVGDWGDLAADAGQVSLHFLNTSGAMRVAPHGGADRRLSTNPLTVGIPRANGEHVILDMTSSMVAEGKLMVAMNKGEHVPAGWIIDKDGKPTTDPKDFYGGGSLLTVGAHKGSGLSVIIDLLSGALTGGRSSDPDDPILRNNMLSIYIDPVFYDKAHSIAPEIDRFVAWVKASPAAIPGQPVLAPGDIERRNTAARKSGGVPLDDTTLAQLREAAGSVGVAVPGWL